MKAQANRGRARVAAKPRKVVSNPVKAKAKPAPKAVAKARKAVAAKERPATRPPARPQPVPQVRPVGRAVGPTPPSKPPASSAAALSLWKQRESYAEAVRLFHAQKFERARAWFQKVIQGPDKALAHHAQVHAQICTARLRPRAVVLKTLDDHYNYAVTMLNSRKLDEATRHLELALKMSPRADHLHYALAVAQALRGNPEGAFLRLRTAIELEPRNRILARTDADFLGILHYPPVVSLLYLDRAPLLRERPEEE